RKASTKDFGRSKKVLKTRPSRRLPMKTNDGKKSQTAGSYFLKHHLAPLKYPFLLLFAIQLVFAAFDAFFFAINGYVLEFKNVGFHYKEEEPVLKNFNLSVPSGQSVALVGQTGAGKSTIVSLLCRFYEPTSGEILLNGLDYRQRSLHWLQSNLGIVLQTPFLFSGTIRENILYGDPEASEERVLEASRVVNAHDFVVKLENGYDTQVGEGGGQLSSGQKQLISFARAVLANPQVLIMDEATSSVDPETEHLIQQGLPQVLNNRTSFIIAHRLSTIRRADRILFIEDGTIMEQGSHEELISLRGEYRNLYEKQFLRVREREILGRSATFN
ncbi:MAG: ATP-binding cassette domain-containing protein, partial [Proteobacteria bacterium]|nr:ATP-binding cassette domain-containing protein [Pseudomonadota bacterium]